MKKQILVIAFILCAIGVAMPKPVEQNSTEQVAAVATGHEHSSL